MKKSFLAVVCLSLVLALSCHAQSGTAFAPLSDYSVTDLGLGPVLFKSNSGVISGGPFNGVKFAITFEVTALTGGNLSSPSGFNHVGIGNARLDRGESLFVNNFGLIILDDKGTGATADDFTVDGIVGVGLLGNDAATDVIFDTDGDNDFETIVLASKTSFDPALSFLGVKVDAGSIFFNNISYKVSIPEPSTFALLGSLFALAGVVLRRRR